MVAGGGKKEHHYIMACLIGDKKRTLYLLVCYPSITTLQFFSVHFTELSHLSN